MALIIFLSFSVNNFSPDDGVTVVSKVVDTAVVVVLAEREIESQVLLSLLQEPALFLILATSSSQW